MIITLCGPYRFSKQMWEKYKELSAQGYICLLPVFDADMPMAAKVMLHQMKIRMSDAIYVVNVGGYFGMDTDQEIRYAKYLDKKVMWYEPKCTMPMTNYVPSQD